MRVGNDWRLRTVSILGIRTVLVQLTVVIMTVARPVCSPVPDQDAEYVEEEEDDAAAGYGYESEEEEAECTGFTYNDEGSAAAENEEEGEGAAAYDSEGEGVEEDEWAVKAGYSYTMEAGDY